MTKVDKNRLKRYVSGSYSAEDERYIIDRFNDKESISELKKSLKEDWQNVEAVDSKKDLDHILDAIHTKIESKPKNGKLISFYKTYSRIAAILLLPLSILFVINHISDLSPQSEQANTAIHAMIGSKVEFTLPDGTSGWLKGGSKLTYLTEFKNRDVYLNGEAFFDVTHDKKRPFQVVGSESKIIVLGTRFNANMWPDKNTTEVVLESGKVKFVSKDNEATILKPGERLIYQKQINKVYVENVKIEDHIGWVNGLLVIRGDNLKQVANKLSSWYQVDVILDGTYSEDYKFRATFKDESIEEVLRLIKLTAPITYNIERQKKLDDGTFSKMKIILKMNEN